MGAADAMSEGKAARYVAEFVGTFMLVFTVGLTAVTESKWSVIGIASLLMVMVYAFGPISGANFNPAVSLSLGLSKKLEWNVVAGYIAVQLLAGLCAGTAFSFLLWDSIKVQAGDGFGLYTAMGAEAIFTAMLCFVVLNVACAGASLPNQYYGLAIGSVIVSGGYAVGGISGACLNPAVTLGLVSSAVGRGALNALAWTFAQIVGAGLGATMFRLVRPEEFGKQAGSMASKALAEFLGTFLLTLTVGLSLVAQSEAAPLAAACCLMSMIYSLGNVSGAHFNPAVSFGILARGGNKLELMQFGVYTAAQFGGGFLAGDLAGLFHWASSRHGDVQAIALAPGEYGLEAAVTTELLFTFVLVFVVLAVATVEGSNSSFSFGLAIASCVTAGGLAAGSISGGVMNPAVALGLMSDNFISEQDLAWKNFLLWTVAEMLGALLAAGVFYMTWRSEYKSSSSTLYAAVKEESEAFTAAAKEEPTPFNV